MLLERAPPGRRLGSADIPLLLSSENEVYHPIPAEYVRPRTDRHHMTALHCASLYGHSDVVLALLKAGADKNAPAAGGKTALHLAAEAGGLEVAKVLLDFGCEKLVVAIS